MAPGYPANATAYIPPPSLHGTVSVGGISRDPEPPSTLTDKAGRVMHMAREVADRARMIEQRLWPTPEKDGAPMPPDPECAPWMIESAESSLERALRILDSIQARL